jgi:hypothetical protein
MKGVANISMGIDIGLANGAVPAAACYGVGEPAPCCTGVGSGTGCGGKYYNGAPLNLYVTPALQTSPGVWKYNWVLEQIARLRSWGFNTTADESVANLWPTRVDYGTWNTADNTIPSQFRMPFTVEETPTLYGFMNKGNCGFHLKDQFSGLSSANQNSVYYDYADYFDPHFASCVAHQVANWSLPTNSAAHDDYFLYITIDESGQTGFLDQGPDFPAVQMNGVPFSGSIASAHPGWVTLVTAPTQNSGPRWNVSAYPDQEVYTKVKFANLLATEYAAQDCSGAATPFAACTGNGTAAHGSVDPSCTGATPPSYCMGDSYIGASEMTNARGRLNSAWGSSYTTLSTSDASCSANLAACLIGNGACTGWGVPYSWCTGSGSGSAMAYGSWGSGSGLLDENGSCPAGGGCWVGEPKKLAGETPAMQADLTKLLVAYVDQYFATLSGAIRSAYPGILLQMQVGGWGAPARKEVIQESAKYLDLPQMTVPEYCPSCNTQAEIDFIEQYLGNRPWITWEGFYANPDSSESQHLLSDNIATTQAARGAAYQQVITSLLNAKDSATGTYHVVGFYWWDMWDMDGEGRNWGLMSVNDNPYDGCSATIAGCGIDKWGYRTGGEVADYGDFLDSVTSANNSVTAKMPP